MPRVLAVANQKGGVAKTTTVHSLGTALAEQGRRVLLVDLDPQACLTYSLGVRADELTHSLHDVLVHNTPAEQVLTKVGDIHLLPSTIDLAGSEIYLLSKTGREYALKRAIEPVVRSYDFVLIDCPPSLGILTIDGLTAADEVLIPLQCETLSSRGVGQLLETVADVRSFTNPGLRVAGVVATMYDGRTRLGQQVLAAVRDEHGLDLLPPPVPKSVKVAEAPGTSRSVLEHAPRSPAADAYRSLAASLLERFG
ncbi:MAG TPA: ParA family protein [Acidimicrobiales bacterium]|nr:ParA family protein [Acidimicrobiales bacterium]